MRQRWQYAKLTATWDVGTKAWSMNGGIFEDQMEAWGQAGWEAYAVLNLEAPGITPGLSTPMREVWFKRPVV
jgi:hypothetical protein